MSNGSCFCGNVALRFTGDIQAKALCHCADCKKISGSAFSTNIIVPGEGFSVTKGSPKPLSRKADSGNQITSYFCPDCGTTLYRDGPSFGDNKVIKVGVLDKQDTINELPAVELYVGDRVKWMNALKGAGQKVAMPDSADA